MRLSELYTQVQAAGNVLAYTVYLAAPDSDGVDVDLAAIGRVEIHADTGEARIYPASTSTDADSIEPESLLGMVLSKLPSDASGENDLKLVVEAPLLRDEAGTDRLVFEEVRELRIASDSSEAWLLLRSARDFADGLLPT